MLVRWHCQLGKSPQDYFQLRNSWAPSVNIIEQEYFRTVSLFGLQLTLLHMGKSHGKFLGLILFSSARATLLRRLSSRFCSRSAVWTSWWDFSFRDVCVRKPHLSQTNCLSCLHVTKWSEKKNKKNWISKLESGTKWTAQGRYSWRTAQKWTVLSFRWADQLYHVGRFTFYTRPFTLNLTQK